MKQRTSRLFGSGGVQRRPAEALRGAGRVARAESRRVFENLIGSRRVNCDGLPMLSAAPCGTGGLPVRLLRSGGRLVQLPGPLGIGGTGGGGSAVATIDGVRPGRSIRPLFAGTDDGVFRSTDRAATWASVGLSGLVVYSLSASNDSVLFAAAGTGGVRYSADLGATWGTGSGFAGEDVRFVAADPNDGFIAYAGTAADGVFRTTNGGLSWAAVDMGIASKPVEALMVTKDGVVYASMASEFGTEEVPLQHGGIWISSDGGVTWVQTAPPKFAVAFARDDYANSTIYLMRQTIGDGYYPFYRSTSVGPSWVAVYPIYDDLSTRPLVAAATDPLGGPPPGELTFSALLYVAWSNTVSRSVDGGTTWTDATFEFGIGSPLCLLVDSDRSVYAGTDSVGVQKSTDAGVTWAAANDGLTNTTVHALAVVS